VTDAFWRRFLVPGALWLAFFFAVPFGIAVAISFGQAAEFGGVSYGWHPQNYADALDPLFAPILLRSVGYAAATALLCLAIGYPAGLLSNIAGEPLGIINTPVAVIGGLVYGYLGFMILPIYASLERMDPALIEAGKDLYGSPRQTFWHVTWPQTLPGVLAGALLVFLPAVGDFVSAQLLGGPDTYMIGNLIQQQFYGADNWPFGAALTVVLMAFLMVFVAFFLRGGRSAERREALA
jgi:spermidine/putrescine transport system permease protein